VNSPTGTSRSPFSRPSAPPLARAAARTVRSSPRPRGGAPWLDGLAASPLGVRGRRMPAAAPKTRDLPGTAVRRLAVHPRRRDEPEPSGPARAGLLRVARRASISVDLKQTPAWDEQRERMSRPLLLDQTDGLRFAARPAADCPVGRGASACRRALAGRSAPASMKGSSDALTARVHAAGESRRPSGAWTARCCIRRRRELRSAPGAGSASTS
jgi:hypothetical protein